MAARLSRAKSAFHAIPAVRFRSAGHAGGWYRVNYLVTMQGSFRSLCLLFRLAWTGIAIRRGKLLHPLGGRNRGDHFSGDPFRLAVCIPIDLLKILVPMRASVRHGVPLAEVLALSPHNPDQR